MERKWIWVGMLALGVMVYPGISLAEVTQAQQGDPNVIQDRIVAWQTDFTLDATIQASMLQNAIRQAQTSTKVTDVILDLGAARVNTIDYIAGGTGNRRGEQYTGSP